MIPLRVLLVEDVIEDAALLQRELERAGYSVALERVETAEAMSTALCSGVPLASFRISPARIIS